MSIKEKALKLADELGLTIHKVHARHYGVEGNYWYYIVCHKNAQAWCDFTKYEPQTKYYRYMNEVSKHMTFDSWRECFDEMTWVQKELAAVIDA